MRSKLGQVEKNPRTSDSRLWRFKENKEMVPYLQWHTKNKEWRKVKFVANPKEV